MRAYLLEVCDYEGLEYKRLIYRLFRTKREAMAVMVDVKKQYPMADCWVTGTRQPIPLKNVVDTINKW